MRRRLQRLWHHAIDGLYTVGEMLIDNVRGLLFVAGVLFLYIGIAGWSTPAARVALGAVLMLFGAFPYLRPKGTR